DPLLEPPPRRGRGSLQPCRDRRPRAPRVRGPHRRAAAVVRRALPTRGLGPRARSCDRAVDARHHGDRRRRRRRSLRRGRRAGGRRAVDRARPRRRRHPLARARPRLPRGSVLPPHRARRGGRMTAVVYRWELRKLVAQKRTYAGFVAAAVFALAFVLVLRLKHNAAVPADIPLGSQVKHTGLALPLVLLQFASIFGAPLITALVASDIFATEHQNATLKTVLTRSVGRGSLYAGKAFAAATYAAAVVLTCGLVAFVGASVAFGLHPLRDVAGATHSVANALGL